MEEALAEIVLLYGATGWPMPLFLAAEPKKPEPKTWPTIPFK